MAEEDDEGFAKQSQIQKGVDFVQGFLPDEAVTPQLDELTHDTVSVITRWIDYFFDSAIDTDD